MEGGSEDQVAAPAANAGEDEGRWTYDLPMAGVRVQKWCGRGFLCAQTCRREILRSSGRQKAVQHHRQRSRLAEREVAGSANNGGVRTTARTRRSSAGQEQERMRFLECYTGMDECLGLGRQEEYAAGEI